MLTAIVIIMAVVVIIVGVYLIKVEKGGPKRVLLRLIFGFIGIIFIAVAILFSVSLYGFSTFSNAYALFAVLITCIGLVLILCPHKLFGFLKMVFEFIFFKPEKLNVQELSSQPFRETLTFRILFSLLTAPGFGYLVYLLAVNFLMLNPSNSLSLFGIFHNITILILFSFSTILFVHRLSVQIVIAIASVPGWLIFILFGGVGLYL